MGAGASSACWVALGYPAPETFRLDKRTFCTVRQLGEGGFSFVFLVRDEDTGAEYALKKCTVQTGEALAAAKEEIIVQRRFDHPCLLPLLAAATVDVAAARPDSAAALTCDDGGAIPTQHVLMLFPAYTEGTLQDVCDAVLAQETRLPAVAVLRIILQAAEGLAAMHEHTPPFAHRDVKPANVLLASWKGLLSASDPGGPAPPAAWGVRAVVMDFGSSRPACAAFAAAEAAGGGSAAARTAARAAVEAAASECTAPYRPPELYDCKDLAALDERVDVWALGCTLYAAMYGTSPFEYALSSGGGGSIALAVLSGRLRWPRERAFPPQLHDAVRWMLAADPAQRPRMPEVVQRMRALLQELPWEAKAAPPADVAAATPGEAWDAFGGAQAAQAVQALAAADAPPPVPA